MTKIALDRLQRSGMVPFGGVITLQLFDSDTISMTFGVFHFWPIQQDPTVSAKNENAKSHCYSVRIKKLKSQDPPPKVKIPLLQGLSKAFFAIPLGFYGRFKILPYFVVLIWLFLMQILKVNFADQNNFEKYSSFLQMIGNIMSHNNMLWPKFKMEFQNS